MNRAEGGKSRGYTILETMIFLAVSAAMFFSAMAFVSGKQNRTEFASAIRDAETSLNDIANDVSIGYYANTTTTGQRITCQTTTNSTTPPVQVFTSAADRQGANMGCIFIGKAVQFAPSDVNARTLVTIPLVGRQFKNGDPSQGDVEQYADSGIKAVATTDTDTTPNAAVNKTMSAAAEVGCVMYGTIPLAPPADHPCTSTANSVKIDTIAFMTQFHGTDTVSGDRESGSNQVNMVVPVTPPILPRTKLQATKALNLYKDGTGGNIITNPKGGIYICLQSTGSKQHALLSMGGNNSRFSTSGSIKTGGCN
jgi:hypothetical protein